ncbi:hypothetical protein QZH41_012739 [Actinostola sp. cb2023]|nr:hypothetical protein QZH41_012739 [Actinostola sp. cb2023]
MHSLMTHYYGQTTSVRASTRQLIGLTSADTTSSPSTQKSLYLEPTLSKITPNSVRPCKKYLDAIRNFPDSRQQTCTPGSDSSTRMENHTCWDRFTHAAESCYASVEGEALAVADVLEWVCWLHWWRGWSTGL